MAAPLITKKQLENRLGREVVEKIYDDNNDGVADTDPLQQLLSDASSKVRGGLPLYNPDDLTPANALLTDELRRLALDAAFAMAAQRHSGYINRNWKELMDQVDADLERVRKGQATLGSNSNPTPADNSLSVVSGESTSCFWP